MVILNIVKETIEKIKNEIPNRSPTEIDMCVRKFHTNLNGIPVKRLFMILPSAGCKWAMKRGGNCTPCGALYYTIKDKKISSKEVIDAFMSLYRKTNFKYYPIISLCSGGSFLSDNEIPKKAKDKILKIIEDNKHIKKIIIESLPQLITEEKLSYIESILKTTKLEIGIGLDVKDDLIRKLCINKNFNLKQYEMASGLLKKYNIDLLTYVHIKSPFLSEKEAIEQAIITSKYAFKKGSKTISLEPIFVMEYTLVDYLYKKGKFKSPWLWSIIEVVKNVYTLGEVRINMNEYFESSYKYPRNYCKDNKCTKELRKRFIKFNQTFDLNIINNFYCDCKNIWEKEITQKESLSIKKRINEYLQ